MYSLELAKTEMYDVVLKFMSFSESYTAMYSYVPCMVYEYPFSYIKVYTFLNLYIEVHTGIYFRWKVYTGMYLNIRFRSDLYHSMVQVPLKSYNSVYQSIYLDIPYFGQVVGIPDVGPVHQQIEVLVLSFTIILLDNIFYTYLPLFFSYFNYFSCSFQAVISYYFFAPRTIILIIYLHYFHYLLILLCLVNT